MVKISAIHRTPPPLSWDFGRTGGAAAAAPRPRYKRALPMASPATATASLCCRLVRLPLLVPYARRRSPLSTRCSAAQSPDAVDREYADLNLRPLYPNVRPLLPPPGLPSLPPQVERERHPSHRSLLVVHAEGPSPAHPAARQPAQLLFLGEPQPPCLPQHFQISAFLPLIRCFLFLFFLCRSPRSHRSGRRCSRIPCCHSWSTLAAVRSFLLPQFFFLFFFFFTLLCSCVLRLYQLYL